MVEVAIVDLASIACELAMTVGGSILEVPIDGTAILEGHEALPLLFAVDIGAPVDGSVWVMLFAEAVWNALVPISLVRHPAGSLKVSFTMADTLNEGAFVLIPTCCVLFALSTGQAISPLAFVTLSIVNRQLALTMAQSTLEPTDV